MDGGGIVGVFEGWMAGGSIVGVFEGWMVVALLGCLRDGCW